MIDDRLPMLALGLGGAALFIWSALLARAMVMLLRERRAAMTMMYLTGFLVAAGLFGSAVGFSVSSGFWSPDFAAQIQTLATFGASAGRAALVMAGLYLLLGDMGKPPKE